MSEAAQVNGAAPPGQPILTGKLSQVADLLREGKSRNEIAEALGVGRQTASTYVCLVRRYDQSLPRAAKRTKRAKVAELAAQGKTLAEIAETLGISHSAVVQHKSAIKHQGAPQPPRLPPPRLPPPSPVAVVAATFAALVEAVDAGDFEAAAKCQRDLDAAGWIVRRKPQNA